MWLFSPILILAQATFLLAIPAGNDKLVDGSIESLREMHRRGRHYPVDVSTLPFDALKTDDGASLSKKRKKTCAECMAWMLKLVCPN